jgi:hypothetical protein
VILQVTDEEALPLIFDLLKQEGFCMGGSTAINIGGKCLDLFIMVAPSGFPNLVWQNIVFSQHVCNYRIDFHRSLGQGDCPSSSVTMVQIIMVLEAVNVIWVMWRWVARIY